MTKIAIIQMEVRKYKEDNLKSVINLINISAKAKAKIIVLPEMFNTPYEIDRFKSNAEYIPDGKTSILLSNMAKQYNVYIIGGSIPELDIATQKYYNSSPIFAPSGELIHVQRKIHLFDVTLPNVKMKESDVFSSGHDIKIIDTGEIRFAVTICFDVRFPLMYSEIAKKGADLIITPAAFSRTTGSAHWHILSRTRAVDNQIYIAMCCPPPSQDCSYQYYGHSLLVNPWGEIITEAGESESIVYGEIDKDLIIRTRNNMPLTDKEYSIIR